MVRLLLKAFLISAMCTALLAVRTFTKDRNEVFAQDTTPTPFLSGPTFTPVVPASEAQVEETILVRVSHYWPPLGGPNCAYFAKGKCLSKMASGERWQDWKGQAIACPPEFDFGTQILIGDRIWVCLDRGGAIQVEDGAVWVDMLIHDPLYRYGEIVEATILPDQFVFTGAE